MGAKRDPKSPFTLTDTERLLILDNRKPSGHTRLNVARGAKRMDRTGERK